MTTAIAPTTQNYTKRERAAVLVAEDELTDAAIASAVGVTRKTLHNWKQTPEFNALVGDYAGQIVAEALKLPIAKKVERVKQLNDLNEAYWQIKEQRGAAYAKMLEDNPDNAALREYGFSVPPWAVTGMLLAQPKIAASGKTVVEWAFDKPLDTAIKETHKQAAQELGQWEDKHNITGELGVTYELVGVDPERLP